MADYDFPEDLLQLQRDWYAAHGVWERDPSEENRFAMVALAEQIHDHAFWGTVENRHKSRMALKQAGLPPAAE